MSCASSVVGGKIPVTLKTAIPAMKVTFFDRQEEDNPLNGSQLVNGKETLNLLERLKSRDPFMCELVGENGYTLLMGLGGSVSSVQYGRSDGEPPYFEAVAPGKPKQIPGTEGHHYQASIDADRRSGATAPEFMMGDTPTPVPTRYALPYASAREIAIYFVETGERDPDILWEEI
jgi:hypothetical protein